VKKFYPYDLQSAQVIELEPHKIVGGKIRLDHIPKEGSLTVRGFVEAKSASNLQSNEFFCSYRADTLYREANCTVQFWSGRANQVVYCSYIAIGTIVTADDMNEIGDFINAADKNFSRHDESLTNLKNLIVEARTEARTSLVEHNQYRAAHSDIRDDISNLERENLNAHADLIRRISDTDANLTAHKAQVIAERNQSILAHNADSTAHADLRNQISTLRGELDINVEDLFTDLAALRGDMDSAIENLRGEIGSVSGLSSIQNDIDFLFSGLSGVESDLETLTHKIDGLSSIPDFDDLENLLSSKVDKVSGKDLSTNDFTDAYKNQLDGLTSTLNGIADDITDLDALLDDKVDKISGKQLSTNDFTTAYKNKLDALNTEIILGGASSTVNGALWLEDES